MNLVFKLLGFAYLVASVFMVNNSIMFLLLLRKTNKLKKDNKTDVVLNYLYLFVGVSVFCLSIILMFCQIRWKEFLL